jgi:hypothetical protein
LVKYLTLLLFDDDPLPFFFLTFVHRQFLSDQDLLTGTT